MIGFKRVLAGAAIGVLCAVAAVPAQAALVQSSTPSLTTWLDTNLTGAALIYDANYYSATEGRLVIVASGNTLAGSGVPNNSNANNPAPVNPPIAGAIPDQTYFTAPGDQLKDMMVQMRLNNANGALISGSVSVTRSNDNGSSGTAPPDSWQILGSINAFGYSQKTNVPTDVTNTFDATFNVTNYDLTDVVDGLVGPGGLFGYAPTSCATTLTNLSCGRGYLRFSTANIAFAGTAVGSNVNFGIDWVRGAAVSAANPQIAPFLLNQLGTASGIDAGAYNTSSVSTDIFMTVPVPGAFALFAAGLLGLGPLARRRQRNA